MKLATALAVLMCILLAPVSSSAAKTLTLDDCIEIALQNRYPIIAARGAESLAKADSRAALGAFLPRVDMSYRYSKTRVRNIKQDAVPMSSLEHPPRAS